MVIEKAIKEYSQAHGTVTNCFPQTQDNTNNK